MRRRGGGERRQNQGDDKDVGAVDLVSVFRFDSSEAGYWISRERCRTFIEMRPQESETKDTLKGDNECMQLRTLVDYKGPCLCRKSSRRAE